MKNAFVDSLSDGEPSDGIPFVELPVGKNVRLRISDERATPPVPIHFQGRGRPRVPCPGDGCGICLYRPPQHPQYANAFVRSTGTVQVLCLLPTLSNAIRQLARDMDDLRGHDIEITRTQEVGSKRSQYRVVKAAEPGTDPPANLGLYDLQRLLSIQTKPDSRAGADS